MLKFGLYLRRSFLVLLALAAILYAGDWLSLKLRIPSRAQTQDLQIQPLLAVPEKGNKMEYILGDPQTETCSNSLFPQLGYRPCWYVRRHTRQRVDM